jgi:ATP-binding cassette subfamily D (ALD) long-chain fatty acid import protein
MDHKRTAVCLLAGSGLLGIVAYSLNRKSKPKITGKKSSISEESSALKEKGVGVNKEFFRQLKVILQICLPGINSRTSGIILLHTLFLFLRTYLSVVVARIDGLLVKNLVCNNNLC